VARIAGSGALEILLEALGAAAVGIAGDRERAVEYRR